MAYTLKCVQQHPDRHRLLRLQPAAACRTASRRSSATVKEHGFKMVQMQANMHAHRPDRALDLGARPSRNGAELGVPVKLHTGDGPYSIPTEWDPDDQGLPTVNFIMAHFGVQTGGVHCFEPQPVGRWSCPTCTANRAGACSRASSSSPRRCPSTRSLWTRRPTSPAWLRKDVVHQPAAGPEPGRRDVSRGPPLGNNIARDDRPGAHALPKTFAEAEKQLGPHRAAAGDRPVLKGRTTDHRHPICTPPTWSTRPGAITGTSFNGERMLKLMDGRT